MGAISLSFGETKSNITLTKESKDVSLKWNDADWQWDSATSKWNAPKYTLNKSETKSKLDLSLLSK